MKKSMIAAVLALATGSQVFAQCGAQTGCPTTAKAVKKACPTQCAKKSEGNKMCSYMPNVCGVNADSLKTMADKVSYSIGKDMARYIKSMPAQMNSNIEGEVNPDVVVAAIIHAVSGSQSLMTDADSQKVMGEFQALMQAAQQQKMQEMQAKQAESGKGALEEGLKFLAENKKKEGVVTTASGLQYKILKDAEGDKPSATDTVEVHYHGTTIDGNVFDSSVNRGETSSFPLNRVIKGWIEGVQLMSVGSKFRFFIPSELAYGSQGSGGMIPPNATLIFDVELFSIK